MIQIKKYIFITAIIFKKYNFIDKNTISGNLGQNVS